MLSGERISKLPLELHKGQSKIAGNNLSGGKPTIVIKDLESMSTINIDQVIKYSGKPAYVKCASVADEGDYDFRTREATYISYVRALVKSASGDVLNDCADHARFWGIEADCTKAKAKYASLMQPWALEDKDFALVVDDNGKKIRKYAAYDASSTQQAAEAFYENRAAYPFEWRNETSARLLAKVASYDAFIPEYVETYLNKAACFGIVDSDAVENAILARDEACPAGLREQFNKTAALLQDMADNPDLAKDEGFVKEAMSAVDRLDSELPYEVPLVEEIISDELALNSLCKVASDEATNHIKLMNGETIDVRSLTKEALSVINPDLAGMDYDELKSVLPTLPKTDAELLSRIS
jgi:hypothetical protein